MNKVWILLLLMLAAACWTPEYQMDGLHKANHDLDKFYLALKIARHI